MTHLHIAPSVLTIRVYDAPGGYEARRPYVGIMTVSHLSDTVVYLHGALTANEKVTREMYEQAIELLRSMGVKQVQLERRGKMLTRTIG